jgi:SAM-dependent methyltransferase
VTVTYWDDLRLHDGGSAVEEVWLSHPLVRQEVNRRVSGDPLVWPTGWLANLLSGSPPLSSAVVIGCGTGGLERDLISKNVVKHVVGLDLAAGPLARARELAVASGIEERVSYVVADAAQYLAERRSQFDAVCFHASLHHFDDPSAILRIVSNALRDEGIVYFDEYVGPSRNQWSALRLLLPNVAYRLLGRGLRRPHLVRAPINVVDPTEAPASHRIMPAVRSLFDIVAARGYGGNLLSVIYPNLHRPPDVPAETLARGVRRLLALERLLLFVPGIRPYYAVVVARKRIIR